MTGSAEDLPKPAGPPAGEAEEAPAAPKLPVPLEGAGKKKGPSEEERLRERLLYLQADFENLQKRLQREKEELRRFAVEGVVFQLIDVKENLELALKSAPQPGPLRDGVEMIRRQLESILQAQGLREIGGVGQRFDPFLHEALEQVDAPGSAPGTIVEEVRRGYTLHGKVIRAALVKVARTP